MKTSNTKIMSSVILATVIAGAFWLVSKKIEQVAVEIPSMVQLEPTKETTVPSGKDENPSQPSTLKVASPVPEDLVISPLTVTGQASTWYFEAVFSVNVTDEKGDILGVGYVQAIGDWMTTDFVPFSGLIIFDSKDAERGFVVFEKANPSNLPENALSFSVPVRFVGI